MICSKLCPLGTSNINADTSNVILCYGFMLWVLVPNFCKTDQVNQFKRAFTHSENIFLCYVDILG